MELNRIITKEESLELVAEGFTPIHKLPSDYLPAWMKEAMKRNGVVRNEKGVIGGHKYSTTIDVEATKEDYRDGF
ncbi:unnamed protein product [Cylicocyclus nassatus]|uniref:Uncharacterized protein n=1 Tax=Cylicocyclus nassatus TaxID=53992 RepID=A0AA36GI45_CYLNA|nr:unnamed protein product [Cylicocyclus nassatus]